MLTAGAKGENGFKIHVKIEKRFMLLLPISGRNGMTIFKRAGFELLEL